jgi:glycosyltransferase involved in cell wall biosynthesis
MENNNQKVEIYKYLVIVIFFCINIHFIRNRIIFIENEEEINEVKKYYEINKNGTLINKKKFDKVENPKVSIISAVYNREQFITRFIRSIQNQFFDDIEIIFIDDCSTDNSTKVIEEHIKEDKRIILLKQKENKGTLMARNIGVLLSKGEYIMVPDPDDILAERIIYRCYSLAKRHDYEMIRFNMHSDKYFPFNIIAENLKSPMYQPEIGTYLIYGYGYKKIVDGIVSNKFVKAESFLKTLKKIDNSYFSQRMIYFEDGLMNYALHRNVKSLYFLKEIGYYYIYNGVSVSHFRDTSFYLKCFFIFLKYIYENTNDNTYEKDMVFYLLNLYIDDINIIKELKNNSEYISICEKIILVVYNCKHISSRTRNKIRKILSIIRNLKKNGV